MNADNNGGGPCGASVSCERTEAALAAVHDLTCLGEILEAIGTNEDVTGALVSWLGERVGKATDVVNAVLLGLPGTADR